MFSIANGIPFSPLLESAKSVAFMSLDIPPAPNQHDILTGSDSHGRAVAGTIEALGAATVLCTDKTGTLTQDHVVLERYVEMIVVRTFAQEQVDEIAEIFWETKKA